MKPTIIAGIARESPGLSMHPYSLTRCKRWVFQR